MAHVGLHEVLRFVRMYAQTPPSPPQKKEPEALLVLKWLSKSREAGATARYRRLPPV